MENKNSYFSLILPVSERKYNEIYLMGLEDKADLIFNAMGVKTQLYRFDQTNKDQIIYFFQTDNRKRKGQLDKYCQQHLPENQEYNIKGMTKFVFETEIKRFENNQNFSLIVKPDIFNEYSASDILIFENQENWHPWQKNIYEMIFDSNYNLKYELLSSDRWEIYEILPNKKLKVRNQKSTETAKKS